MVNILHERLTISDSLCQPYPNHAYIFIYIFERDIILTTSRPAGVLLVSVHLVWGRPGRG